MLKQLTGRDYISANRKFLPRILFVNYAKLIFAANERPSPKDDSQAFFARWVLLDFPYTFTSQEEIDKETNPEKKRLMKLRDENILVTVQQECHSLAQLKCHSICS